MIKLQTEPNSVMANRLIISLAIIFQIASTGDELRATELRGRIFDADTKTPLAARIYIEADDGRTYFAETTDPNGSAIAYKEQWVPMKESVDRHTTLSPHPFRTDVPPGRYTITIERGKEYRTLFRLLRVEEEPLDLEFPLHRWINMAARGWYSGETHVHRRISELENVQLAEDLNVTFPVTFWTTESTKAPDLEPSSLRSQGPSPHGPREDRGFNPITIDNTHVMIPRNTEYEIFKIGEEAHTLGAMFLLNHRSRFTQTAPPISAIAEQAHSEGAILDLDKHSWPWSMMLVPVAKIDLYELLNNSNWRTEFGFKNSPVEPAEYMNVYRTEEGEMTEASWIQFTLENYYTLLNCGFKLSPSAGTASGVHPVPLGFNRVYVHQPNGFSVDGWLQGLKEGRSFVTNGPMLMAKVNGREAGYQFSSNKPFSVEVSGLCVSNHAVDFIEIIQNGKIVGQMVPKSANELLDLYSTSFRKRVTFRESGWVIVRCQQEYPQGRLKFAHSAPWYVNIGNQPVRPRQEETDYLIGRLEYEFARNRSILAEPALAEFETALAIYKEIAKRAKPNQKK